MSQFLVDYPKGYTHYVCKYGIYVSEYNLINFSYVELNAFAFPISKILLVYAVLYLSSNYTYYRNEASLFNDPI